MFDVSEFIKPKTDQLNGDDLKSGPITVRITRARRGDSEQPVVLEISDHLPWKPCKTTMRILVHAWGPDASQWVGRQVTLYRDPSVRFGRDQVGGIRISHLSHIDRRMAIRLAVSKGKYEIFRVDVIHEAADAPQQQGAPTADLAALLDQAGITEAQVDAWRHARGKGPVGDLADDERAQFAAWLGGDPARLEAIRAEGVQP